MLVASFTSFVGDHSVYAIFGLMAAAAVVPAASELVMIYGGALASGALAGSVHLFGHSVRTHAWAYVTVAVAGLLGNSLGAAVGWAIGAVGGRPLVERYGRYVHVDQVKLERTERWLDTRGALFVFAGLALPIVRSFVAVPAGTARMDFVRFFPAAAAGIAIFCFGLAGGARPELLDTPARPALPRDRGRRRSSARRGLLGPAPTALLYTDRPCPRSPSLTSRRSTRR